MAAYACSTASGSTTSGTYSTTYNSTRGSVVSSEPDLALLQLSRIDLLPRFEYDEERLKRIERAKRLVKEFCHRDGDIGGPKRWLSELGVGWVLDLSDDPSAGTSLVRAQPQRKNLTEKWIRALTEIKEYTRLVSIDRFLGEEQGVPDQFERFVLAAVLKMIPFVDALLSAADLDAGTGTADATGGAQVLSEEKLQTLLNVRDALSSTSQGIQCYLHCWYSSVEMETQRQRRSDGVLSILSAKEHELDEAIWNTVEEIRTSILNDGDDDKWGIQTLKGSPDICKVTQSLVTYIKYLWIDRWRLSHIVCIAAELGNYVPEQNETDPLTALTMETVSSLEVKLAKRSEAFRDHSLMFLFLMNNTHFILRHLRPLFPMKSHVAVLTTKTEDYIQKYLQVSWEPVLSCLHNHTPYYCFKTNSALPKFDTEFQKTYSAQKLWKVPDPELRTKLRKAIVEKVVSGLTRYLEDNNVTNPGVTPQELEEMLLELFEG